MALMCALRIMALLLLSVYVALALGALQGQI
jgi:hypothetical protein